VLDILQMEYIVFDVETTGLSVTEGDRIVELAALRVKGGQVVASIVSLVNPGRSIPQSAQEINKITEDMLLDAPSSADILPQMIPFSANACLVAHNASFDIKFVAYELALMGRKFYDATPVIDTMKMARELLPYLSSYRLSSVAGSLGLKVVNAHRAQADAELTAMAFTRLLAMASDRGVKDLKDLVARYGVEKPSFKMSATSQGLLF